MLTGFNTDVSFEDVVYHVQTEDRGLDNPILDTLVYCGGQILHQEMSSYKDLLAELGEGEALDRQLAPRLDRQHRDFVRRVRHGEFAQTATNLSVLMASQADFREALETFVENDPTLAPLEVMWTPAEDGSAGFCGRLSVCRRGKGGKSVPVENAAVRARLIARRLNPVPLLDATTDAGGELAVAVALPPGSASAIVFSAQCEDGAGLLRVTLPNAPGFSLAGLEEPAEFPSPGSSS